MNFVIYFHFFLAFILTSQVSAFNLRYKPGSSAEYIPDNTELEISQRDWKKPYLYLRGTKKIQEDNSEEGIDEKTLSLYAKTSLYRKSGINWWPSEVDYSDRNNEIPPRISDIVQPNVKKPATFEELETRNANIHNPLLNLDHYPNPSKKYTFEELENMNANQYNPYLN